MVSVTHTQTTTYHLRHPLTYHYCTNGVTQVGYLKAPEVVACVALGILFPVVGFFLLAAAYRSSARRQYIIVSGNTQPTFVYSPWYRRVFFVAPSRARYTPVVVRPSVSSDGRVVPGNARRGFFSSIFTPSPHPSVSVHASRVNTNVNVGVPVRAPSRGFFSSMFASSPSSPTSVHAGRVNTNANVGVSVNAPRGGFDGGRVTPGSARGSNTPSFSMGSRGVSGGDRVAAGGARRR